MRGVASRIFAGIVFVTVEPGPIDAFGAGDMIHYAVFLISQSFTNRRRAKAHAIGVSCHGMVCLLHR
jgi:hypothetical protein